MQSRETDEQCGKDFEIGFQPDVLRRREALGCKPHLSFAPMVLLVPFAFAITLPIKR
jgi:hypothetical protein